MQTERIQIVQNIILLDTLFHYYYREVRSWYVEKYLCTVGEI